MKCMLVMKPRGSDIELLPSVTGYRNVYKDKKDWRRRSLLAGQRTWCSSCENSGECGQPAATCLDYFAGRAVSGRQHSSETKRKQGVQTIRGGHLAALGST
jgi:hypothetical protein